MFGNAQNGEPTSRLSPEELRSLEDDALMAQLQCGQGDALGVLFERYHRLVLHIALKVLHDVSEAEDVMQTVFMEIYRFSVQFDPSRGTTKMWLIRCAYNRSINRRKQLLARQFYSSIDVAFVEDELSGASNVAASQEARALIAHGFEALSPMQRKVIELVCFEGLTMNEIATETGESFGNVRHHYYRGLDRLRSALTEAEKRSDVTLARKEVNDAEA